MQQTRKLIAQIKLLGARADTVIHGWKYQIFTKDGSIDFKLTEVQKRLHESPHRKNIILKSRQLGITSYCVLRAIHEVLFKPGRVSLIVCPSESQVATIRGYVDQILSHSLLKVSYKDKILQIENSGKIVFTNSNTDSCRGLACDYIYITEGQDYDDVGKVLEGVLPTISTRPAAKVFIDGTMPKKADSSFLQLFGEVLDFIPDAREQLIIDFDGLWLLFNPDISREDVGDAYDREVLLELPLTGTECRTNLTDELPSNVVSKQIFEYRGTTILADYYGNGLVVSRGNILMDEIKQLIASNKYTINVSDKIFKALPSKAKNNINHIKPNLGHAYDMSELIATNVKTSYYLDSESGIAKTELGMACLFLNKVLSNEK
jgi:hypothetical protein